MVGVIAAGAIATTIVPHTSHSARSQPAPKANGSSPASEANLEEPLAAVACPTSTECVAVGGAGRVLVSQDAAASWTPQVVPSDHYLFGVACQSGSRCVAVGDAGTVLVSDGLAHWRQVESGTHEPLSSVTCPAGPSCFATGDGGTIVASTDDGRSWQRFSVGFQDMNAVACSSSTRCVAVTSNAEEAFLTTKGTHWSPAAIPTIGLLSLNSMNGESCFVATCVSVGERGTIAYSDDGGASWGFVYPSITAQTLNAVSCSAANQCIAVGANGTILVTDTGGVSWVQRYSPNTETLLGVDCRTDGLCVAVGDGGTIVTAGTDRASWDLNRGTPVPAAATMTVLVVGDSFAHTLAQFVGRVSGFARIELVDGGIDGCGLARGVTIALAVDGPCAATGPGWPATYAQDVEQYKPDVSLLVLGPWDLSARLIDGQWLSPGQTAYDAYYADQLRTALGILSSQGGRVVVATAPYVLATGPELCAPPPTTVPNCPSESDRVHALDTVARQITNATQGKVSLIDLGGHLSPNNQFAPTIDGVVVRAADGVHLSEPGGEWLAAWLLPQVVAAERAES